MPTDTITLTPPAQETKTTPQKDHRPQIQPPYNVLLHDDDDHTYEYVVKMLCALFRVPVEQAFLMAVEVDTSGRVIVDTTTMERAELKRDQIHAYGRDSRISVCKGSMTATIEPAF